MAVQATVAYIALGANLGDRPAALQAAVHGLAAHDKVEGIRASPVYEAEAHTLTPDDVQPPYLNAVVEVITTLTPEALLAYCRRLEQAAGRTRGRAWAPRTLDLDLLAFGSWKRHTPGLNLPHLRLGVRRFVLQPWADLAPNFYVPTPYDATVADLLRRCPDADDLVRTEHRLLKPFNPT